MGFSRTVRALVFVFLAWVMIAPGAAGSALAGEVVFRVQVKNLGQQLPHLNRGKSFEDTVETVLPGELFAPPRRLGTVARAQVDRSTPEGLIASDFSAWKADDADWIRANFAAGDQAALAQFLDDAQMRAASKAGFAKLDSVYLWGVARHEPYVLALLTYGQGTDRSRALVATLVEEADGWKRTNALSRDETLDLVWAAFRVGEMVAQP